MQWGLYSRVCLRALGRAIWLVLSSYTHSEVHSSGREPLERLGQRRKDQEEHGVANASRAGKADSEGHRHRELRPARRS